MVVFYWSGRGEAVLVALSLGVGGARARALRGPSLLGSPVGANEGVVEERGGRLPRCFSVAVALPSGQILVVTRLTTVVDNSSDLENIAIRILVASFA